MKHTHTQAGTGPHAILLTPFPPCPWNIVSDNNCVDVNDLLAVITHWGACQVGSICDADVNGDCVVDVNDLNAVNGHWGCPACGSGPNGPSGGGGGLTIPQLIAVVLQAPIPQATQAAIIHDLLNH